MPQLPAVQAKEKRMLVGILLLIAIFPLPAFGQSINTFSIGQISWQGATGAPLAGGTNSGWGALTMSVTPAPALTYYVNMSARLTGSGNPMTWLVRNLPILPVTAGADVNQQVALNLPDLAGFVTGSLLGNLDVVISLDASPQVVQPGGSAFNNTVTLSLIRRAQEAKLNLASPNAYIGIPSGHKADGANAVAPTNVIQHKNVPGVQEGDSQCLAGSFARSLKWLDQEYDLPNLPATTTAQDIFGTLTGPPHNVSSPTTTYEQDVEAKQAYFKAQDNRATTKILDLGTFIGPVAGTTEYTGIDLIAYLNSQLPTEDVELHYDTHIVTVTGIYKQGGKTFVKYRDDEHQGDNTKGDAAEKDAELTVVGGKYHFNRNDGFANGEIKVAIAESVVESAVPIPTLGEWGWILLVTLLLGTSFYVLMRRTRQVA